MRVLALVGSYRKNGNTARVVDQIQGHLKQVAARSDEALEVEILYLGHHDIGLCRGCRVCFNQGEARCPLRDDLLTIKAKMLEADGLLLASPVYVNDVSGATKNWMDRMAHVSHRPQFAGKCAYLVATVGNGPTGHALRTMRMALEQWGFHIAGQAGFKTGALMSRNDLVARYQTRCDAIARRLFDAIHQRRYAKPPFLSLMTFRIQQHYWQQTTEDSVDYRYWNSRGWIGRRREFYIQHESGRLKVAAARLTGDVVARFVT